MGEHGRADAVDAGAAAAAPELDGPDSEHGEVERPENAFQRVNAGAPDEFPDDQKDDARYKREDAGEIAEALPPRQAKADFLGEVVQRGSRDHVMSAEEVKFVGIEERYRAAAGVPGGE